MRRAFSGIENVAFFSLAEGSGRARCRRRAEGGFDDRRSYRRKFETFDDTAAFIDSLDLVITVCTSVAHLAARSASRPGFCSTSIRTGSGNWSAPTAPGIRPRRCIGRSNFAQWEPVMDDVARDLAALAATRTSAAARRKRRTCQKSGDSARAVGRARLRRLASVSPVSSWSRHAPISAAQALGAKAGHACCFSAIERQRAATTRTSSRASRRPCEPQSKNRRRNMMPGLQRWYSQSVRTDSGACNRLSVPLHDYDVIAHCAGATSRLPARSKTPDAARQSCTIRRV